MFTQQSQIPRSPFASTFALVFHGALGIVVLAVGAVPNLPKVVERERLTFIVAAAPPPNFEYQPPPPPREPARIEPRPVPKPVEAFAAPAVVTPKPPTPQPERAPEPVAPTPAPMPPPAPSAMPKPAVVVGAFADATSLRKPEVNLEAVPTGFDGASAQTSRSRREVAVVGGFDSGPAATGATRAAQISDAGFGADAARAPEKKALVAQATDFSADATTAAKPAQAARPQAERAVEVLFKPTPSYTDDARAQGIEGNVVLEVEFTATGQVRVLRVVKGLGYGLDDMARRATEQIRFRPATNAGVPVDFRAQLTVVFRLT